MDENRIQDYLNLIQQLLSCPNGEEPKILQANSELLDLEFLQVCEAESAQLAEGGKEKRRIISRGVRLQDIVIN